MATVFTGKITLYYCLLFTLYFYATVDPIFMKNKAPEIVANALTKAMSLLEFELCSQEMIPEVE